MNEESGLRREYAVQRIDGRDAAGGDLHGCEYFVLDVTNGKHSAAALRGFADACEADEPELAESIRKRWLSEENPGDADGGSSGPAEEEPEVDAPKAAPGLEPAQEAKKPEEKVIKPAAKKWPLDLGPGDRSLGQPFSTPYNTRWGSTNEGM